MMTLPSLRKRSRIPPRWRRRLRRVLRCEPLETRAVFNHDWGFDWPQAEPEDFTSGDPQWESELTPSFPADDATGQPDYRLEFEIPLAADQLPQFHDGQLTIDIDWAVYPTESPADSLLNSSEQLQFHVRRDEAGQLSIHGVRSGDLEFFVEASSENALRVAVEFADRLDGRVVLNSDASSFLATEVSVMLNQVAPIQPDDQVSVGNEETSPPTTTVDPPSPIDPPSTVDPGSDPDGRSEEPVGPGQSNAGSELPHEPGYGSISDPSTVWLPNGNNLGPWGTSPLSDSANLLGADARGTSAASADRSERAARKSADEGTVILRFSSRIALPVGTESLARASRNRSNDSKSDPASRDAYFTAQSTEETSPEDSARIAGRVLSHRLLTEDETQAISVAQSDHATINETDVVLEQFVSTDGGGTLASPIPDEAMPSGESTVHAALLSVGSDARRTTLARSTENRDEETDASLFSRSTLAQILAVGLGLIHVSFQQRWKDESRERKQIRA